MRIIERLAKRATNAATAEIADTMKEKTAHFYSRVKPLIPIAGFVLGAYIGSKAAHLKQPSTTSCPPHSTRARRIADMLFANRLNATDGRNTILNNYYFFS